MPIVVFDDFNRADNPTVLGTANTGQTWSQVAGNWGINTNTALVSWDNGDPITSIATIESGLINAVTSVVLPSVDVPNFAAGIGLIFRYVDPGYYWRLMTFDFPGPPQPAALRLQVVYAGVATTVIDVVGPTLVDGDKISVSCCGPLFEIFINDVSQGTYDDSGNAQNYGTRGGLVSISGTFFAPYSERFEDFTVETNATCAATYNCTASGCVDPGDGTGTYATLADCLTACSVAASYNCIAGQCFDPGDGTGTFATLTACIDSGCGGGTTGINTTRFDQGIGNSWYVVLPLIDSGEELRSKVLKAIREIGKVTNAAIKVYGYDVDAPITVSDLEDGTNSTTGSLGLSNTTQVTQSQRVQINVPNAVLHTVRIEGDDTGQSTRDTVHEIAMEQAEEGVRR